MGNNIKIEQMAQFYHLYFALEGDPVSHMKLHKLLYYTQGWHLAYFDGNPLFVDKPQAWMRGPVYRTVYNRYKDCPPNEPLPFSYENLESEYNKSYADLKQHLDENQMEFISAITKKYGFTSTSIQHNY